MILLAKAILVKSSCQSSIRYCKPFGALLSRSPWSQHRAILSIFSLLSSGLLVSIFWTEKPRHNLFLEMVFWGWALSHSASMVFGRGGCGSHSDFPWGIGPFSSGSNQVTQNPMYACFYLQRGDENDIRSINYYPESASFDLRYYPYYGKMTHVSLYPLQSLLSKRAQRQRKSWLGSMRIREQRVITERWTATSQNQEPTLPIPIISTPLHI